MADPQQVTAWDASGNPIQPAVKSQPKAWDAQGNPVEPPSLTLTPQEGQQATDALVYSHLTGAPPSYTYENRDAIHKDFSSRLGEYAEAGWQGLTKDSVIGLALRGQVSSPFESDDQIGKFIEGLGTMIADVPYYIAGGALGAFAGPAGAGAGAFALPATLRQMLIDGYNGKKIESFDGFMDAIKAAGKGALTGAAFGAAGELAPLAEGVVGKYLGARAYKTAAELAAMTTVGSLVEGKVPTAKDFASNAAMLALMHVSIGSLEFAKKSLPDIQSKAMELYARENLHPAELASEAARRAVNEPPTDNPMEVINRIENEISAIPGKTPEHAAESNTTEAKGATESEQPKGETNPPEGETSIKNETTEAEREQRGLSPVEVEARQTPAFEAGRKAVDSPVDAPGHIDPRELAKELAEKPRPHTDEEAAALLYDRMRLQNEHAVAMNAIETARAAGDKEAEARGKERLTKIEDAMNNNDTAARLSGTETGRALNARRMMIKQDYSLANVLQRARAASATGEVSPAVRENLENLNRQLDEANKKLDDYEETKKQQAAERTVEKIKADRERTVRSGKRAATKDQLGTEFDSLIKELNSELMTKLSANPMLNPKLYELFGKLAINRIHSGLVTIEQIVDDLHGQLQERGISKREIRDYISQYGRQVKEPTKNEVQAQLREAQKQGKLISAIEDAEAGEEPQKGKPPGKPSARVQELRKQLDAALNKEEPEEKVPKEPKAAGDVSGRESARQKAVEKSIAELDRRIKAKDTSPASRLQGPDTETLDSLKEQRDALRETYEEMKADGVDKGGAKERARAKALQKSIADLEQRISRGDTSAKPKMQGPDTEEASALKDRRDALRETLDSMKERVEKEKADPAARALKSYKTRITKRIADLQKQLDTKDYSQPTRKQTILDQQAEDLKAQAEKIKGQVDEAIHKQKLAARTPLEKAAGVFQKWRRGILISSVSVGGKIGNMAAQRFGVTPIEELVGGVLSHVPGLDDIAAKAPRQGGGLNLSAEGKAFVETFSSRTAKDMWEVLKTGKGSLDYLYGKKNSVPPELIDFVGHVHGALQTPTLRSEFTRSLEKRAAWAEKNNLDIQDPKVQATLAGDAYVDAQRAVFRQENFVNDAFRSMLRTFENKGLSGKSVKFMIETVLPIVKLPLNIVGETIEYSTGVVTGSIRALDVVLRKGGLDNLTGHEADNIMRALKKGSVGLAVLAMGYYAGQQGGFVESSGFHQEGDKKKEVFRIGGVELPSWALDTPLGLTLQIGATMRRVNDAYTVKGKNGFVAGATAGAIGAVKKIPFTQQAVQLGQALHSPETAGLYIDDLIQSLLIPPDVRKLAAAQDPQNKDRKPTDLPQTLEKSIPGLQQNVPLKKAKKGFRIR
jgi:hypothetical protein